MLHNSDAQVLTIEEYVPMQDTIDVTPPEEEFGTSAVHQRDAHPREKGKAGGICSKQPSIIQL